MSMGMPGMPSVLKEFGEKDEKNKKRTVAVGHNMCTSTMSLEAMEPPTDEEVFDKLSSKPGKEF